VQEIKYIHPTHPNYLLREPYSKMVSCNIITPIVEQEFYIDTTFLEKQRSSYKRWHNLIFAVDTIFTQRSGHNEEARVIYQQYDAYGNPLQAQQKGGASVVYLWGYKGQHPIAEIKNATYEQVKTAIGESSIVRISDQTSLTTSDENLINSLRDRLTNAEINTYTYQPLVGIKTHTDPRGITTYYEYDDYGQLARIRDNSGNVLQSYEYNYVNR
jgi:YD repeat-containing protein